MPHVQFGLTLPIHLVDAERRSTFVADLERALILVEGHFSSAWAIDHLHTYGGTGLLEGYTSIAYFAARHPRLHFGNIVLCQSYRNPALLAKMSASLQFLSGGRFILGIGAGWHKEEYLAYGYDFPPAGVRVAQLEEAVQIIRWMWTEEQVTFEGRYYQVRGAFCEPKPEPIPPVMIGAYGPKMLRLTAKYADDWNIASVGPQDYRRRAAEFERACAEVGRDPAAVSRSWSGGIACAATQAQAEALAGDRISTASEDDYGFVGTPQQVVEQMQPFIDLGVSTFMLDCAGFPDLTMLEHLVGEVLPQINPSA